jgi:NitT/TauT family transport system ATP-binding protein
MVTSWEQPLPRPETAKIRVEGLGHRYRALDGREVEALRDLHFEVGEGEVLTVVGPSGCGKSTLIHLVAGLIRPSRGRVLVDGQEVRRPGRDRGVVFQELAILPWRTVRQNIAHGLEIARVPPARREEIVRTYVELVGLQGFEDHYPRALSGGMRQRVAVARTLAADPVVMLMDEPFANVDAQTRITLQEEMVRISLVTRKTILFVTHSVDEAVFLGDRVLVLTRRPGTVKEIIEVGIPRPERRWDAVSREERFRAVQERVLRSVRAEVGEGTA